MTPDYKTDDPRGWGGDPKRGAALGRCAFHVEGYAGRLFVSRVSINRGGYDRLGTYWGIGQPLYWIASEDKKDVGAFGVPSYEPNVSYFIRASNRQAAVSEALSRYPGAKVRP